MDEKKFKSLLDEHYTWPSSYIFKFIVNREKENELISHLEGEKWEKKESRSGRYSRFNVKILANSSDEIIGLYRRVRQVEGLISL